MREKIIRHKKVYTRFNSSEYNDFLFPLRPVSCVSNVATCLWIGHSCTQCCHMSLDWPFLYPMLPHVSGLAILVPNVLVPYVATCLWIGHSCTQCCHMSLDWPFLYPVATCLWIGHSCTLCCHMSLDWPFLITPSVFSNVYSHALRECALCLLQASMSVTDATRAVK